MLSSLGGCSSNPALSLAEREPKIGLTHHHGDAGRGANQLGAVPWLSQFLGEAHEESHQLCPGRKEEKLKCIFVDKSKECNLHIFIFVLEKEMTMHSSAI